MSKETWTGTPEPVVDKLVPRGDLSWLVNRLHVGTPDSEIAADIAQRCAGREGWTPELVKQAQDYALWCHAENRAMARAVMRGSI